MARRNAELEAVLAELHGASVPYVIEQGGSHLKVRFSAHGREEFVTVSVSGSDVNGAKASAATTRRILKGLRPGDTGPTEKQPEPAELEPPPKPADPPVKFAGIEEYQAQAASERWISAAEAGEFLGLCPSSMSRMASTGAIKSRKVPGRGRGGSLEFEEQSVLQRALSHPPRVKPLPPPPQVPATVSPSPAKVSPLAPIVVDESEEVRLAAEAEGMTEPEYRRMALDMALVTSRARHNGGMPFGKATDPALAAIVQAEVRRQLANGGRKP